MRIFFGIISLLALIMGYYVGYHIVINAAPEYFGCWVIASVLAIVSFIGNIIQTVSES